jgi:hypothetical protein
MNRSTLSCARASLAWIGLALVLFLAGCSALPTPTASTPTAPAPVGTSAALPTLTPIPGVRATLTALPKSPPMSQEQARLYQELRAAVERCNAYNENRKLGILSQIDYLLQPATVPSDFVLLYGDEWRGRLLYGSAYLSALEWKLAGRDRSSCLYPIGVSFNALLRDLHQSTFPEFE